MKSISRRPAAIITTGSLRAGSTACALAMLSACGPDSPPMPVDTTGQEMVIADLETEWSDRYGARDIDGVMSMLARDTVLLMPGSEPIVGIDAVRQATQEMLQSDDEVSWRSDFAYVAPGGDMAYDYGTATTTFADGTTTVGNYLVVWVREGGEWKVAADMFN